MEDATREENNDGDDRMDMEQCGTSRLTDVLPLTAWTHAMASCGLGLAVVYPSPSSIPVHALLSTRWCACVVCVCVSDVYRGIYPIVYHHGICHVGFPVVCAVPISSPLSLSLYPFLIVILGCPSFCCAAMSLYSLVVNVMVVVVRPLLRVISLIVMHAVFFR